MPDTTPAQQPLDLRSLTGTRRGPYLSFNPVSRVQIWQWCSAMGDNNPLYLDDAYHREVGIDRIVAPPAMMQMWSMRDVDMQYAPGSTDAAPYEALDHLAAQGFPDNVAVSYDITFHHYLVEHDRAHHYTTVIDISALKSTGLGDGYFVTERVEYLDQNEKLFAEALITYFQYRPKAAAQTPTITVSDEQQATAGRRQPPGFQDLSFAALQEHQPLPELAIPITHKLIVSGAIASQDFIDVHHNAKAAEAAGMPDIFMNILTTCGLSARYLSDWAGPGSRLKNMQFKLMAPNHPGDTMTMQGRVSKLEHTAGENRVTVDFTGNNARGSHVSGSATLGLNN